LDQIHADVFLPICVKYNSSRLENVRFGGFFIPPTAEAPTPIFTQNTSKDAVPCRDVPFGGFGSKKIIFRPTFGEKPPFWGLVLAVLGKFSTENRLTMGRLRSKLPFIVIVAP